MFTPSAPRHRGPSRAGYAASPLPRSPMVPGWRPVPAATSTAKPTQQPAGRSRVYSVESSPHCNVKLLRTSLPPSVAEFSPSCDASDVKLHPSGWAWLVTRQHQLLIWRYDQTTGKQGYRPPRPISLPSGPLPYTSAQVCVFSNSASASDEAWGVVTVSSNGHVRCWPQWPKSSSCSDIQMELPAGHSCASIVDCMPHGCVIATQKGDLFLLSVSPESSSLTWRTLYSRSGTLAGLRRRVSSLFFISAAEEHQFKLTALASDRDDTASDDLNIDRDMVVLGETSIEKWHFSTSGDKLVSTVDLNSLPVKEAIAEQIVEDSPESNVSFDGLHVRARDVLMENRTIFLLVTVSDRSTVASSVKADELFLLGLSLPEGSDERVVFARKIVLTNLDALRSLPSWTPHLLHMATAGSFDLALTSVFADRQVDLNGAAGRSLVAVQTLFDVDVGVEAESRLLVVLVERDFMPSADVLASASARTVAKSTSSAPAAVPVAVSASTALTRSPIANTSSDRYMQLRSTFLTFCQSESQSQCLSAVQCLFPSVTSELDSALVQLSRELINDRGVSDPRWAERNAMTADPLSTAALLSAQQDLHNTQDVHDTFLQFVISMEWWDKLGVVANYEHHLPTELLLGEHSEKVAAAAALVAFHCKHPSILDRAVEHALAHRDSVASATSSPHHQFYHQVEGIADILASLVACLQQQLSSSAASGNIGSDQETELFITTNSIVEGFLAAATQRRQKAYAVVFSPSVLQRSNQTEYLPWTASSGNSGARASLLRLFTLMAERAIPSASRSAVQQDLLTQLGRLADNILDGFQTQLVSAKTAHVSAARMEELQGDMERARRQIIQPFLEHKQRETARQLAERYGDFAALIILAETAGDDNQLLPYMCKFAEQGFAEYVFKYYLDQGMLAKLLSQPAALHQKLAAFLEPHSKLRWLHCLAQGDFMTAHTTLYNLAEEETVFLAKKKTLLSLAKLSYVAEIGIDEGEAVMIKPDDHYFTDICQQQELVSLQEQMPPHIREELQLDFSTMRPLLPLELIEAFVGENNTDAEPEDFLRALDALKLVNPSDDDRHVQSCFIWAHALLKEQAFWQSVEESERQDSVANTIFCRTVKEAAHIGDLPLYLYLPTPQSLLQSALLAPLQLHARPAVCFWLQAAYDHVVTAGDADGFV